MINSGQFKKGLVYGVGIDDTDYQKERRVYSGKTSKVVWFCDAYSRWKNMLRRCYFDKGTSYDCVAVCVLWHHFSQFKLWYDQQEKPNVVFDLDKDLISGKSYLYSPETCCLLPRKINSFLSVSNSEKGLPGSYYDVDRDKYQAYCAEFDGVRIRLGRHQTEEIAHSMWQIEKANQVLSAKLWYEGLDFVNPVVVESLRKIHSKMLEDIDNRVPTKDLKLEAA